MARDDEHRTEERRIPYRLVAALVAFGLLLWFALANSGRVDVDFLVTERRVRLVYALAIAALLGLVIGWFAARERRR
jgi:uncharacterized integral membrane protein